MSYINQNQENIPGDLVAEMNQLKIDTLIAEVHQRNNQELAKVYDWLNQALTFRGKSLSQRLKSLRTYHGKDQQIVSELDPSHPEYFSYDDTFRNTLHKETSIKFEEIMSVNQQITNVMERKENFEEHQFQ